MFLALASSLLLLGQVDTPLVPSEQLRELIHAKSAPLKSLVFVYDARDRWIGDPKMVRDAQLIDREYQGTFLYRSDGAALCDVYATSFIQGGVVRNKTSVLNNRMEVTRDLIDALQQFEPGMIQKYPGSLASFQTRDAPLDLFPLWSLENSIDHAYHEVAVEGWDVVAGRTCVRVRASMFENENDHDRDHHKRT